MKIYSEIDKTVDFSSKVILHYTGSMYGVGTFISNSMNIGRISLNKCRTSKKGFIVLLSDIEDLNSHFLTVTQKIKRFLSHYWPGNLTLLLKSTTHIFSEVQMDGFIAVRVPKNKLLRELIRKYNTPFLSTSINLTGATAESNLDTIIQKYQKWFDCGVLSDRPKKVSSTPSTIIKIFKNEIIPIRVGEIPIEDLEKTYQNI